VQGAGLPPTEEGPEDLVVFQLIFLTGRGHFENSPARRPLHAGHPSMDQP